MAHLQFSISPRILKHLGNDLIKDESIALFELVKNSYDACATKCEMFFKTNQHANIVDELTIKDNGLGMCLSVIENVWLTIGTDNKAKNIKENDCGRLPLGEKGIGRLSVHKLGNIIEMYTRSENHKEVHVFIDWNQIDSIDSIDEFIIKVEENDVPVIFKNDTGTYIKVHQLKGSWDSRGKLRDIYRTLLTFSTPFDSNESFRVNVSSNNPKLFDDLPKVEDILQMAMYKCEATISGSIISKPVKGLAFLKSLTIFWSSAEKFESGNIGHRPSVKGGYFPVPPVDSLQDIRAAMVLALEEAGVPVEVFHHEVATAGQCEIGTQFSTLTKRADWTQILKYIVHNVAHAYGKTATFMPKPIVGDNGSGMHVHMSLWKDGKNLFAGNGYAGLSELALYYIGGVIKHAKALNAITNPSTNSYKRLVPGFEAPVMLAYSARNRSASIRIPIAASEKARRIETRFPDPMANPYLCFAALMMAGLDGIQNKIHPGDPSDKNLYDLPPEEEALVPKVCHSLDMALDELDKDREFLTRGGVFTNDMIDAYIELKMEDVTKFRMTTHPAEFAMYYSL